jgi:rubredoxin
MALWECLDCGTLYSPGAPRCPFDGSTDYEEFGDDGTPPLAATPFTHLSVDGEPVVAYDIDSAAVGVSDLAGVDEAGAVVGAVLAASAVTSPGEAGAHVTGWSVASPAFVPVAFTNQSARYAHPICPHDQSTSATLTNGTLRLAPWVVPFPMTIDRLGAKITSAGEAGAKLRLGIYSDTGNTYPGALLLDAGQINGDSATVQELTVSQVLAAGLYWIGGAVQAVVTTQPTVEITNDWTPPVPLLLTTSAPAVAATSVGYAQTSVTGALPANFTSTVTATGSAPRLHIRHA